MDGTEECQSGTRGAPRAETSGGSHGAPPPERPAAAGADGSVAGGAKRILIHSGGPLNALVWRVEAPDGAAWIEKDFSRAPLVVRATLGRMLVVREVRVLRRLAASGVVPGGVERISPYALREDEVSGFALRDSACGVYRGNSPDPSKARGIDVAEMSKLPPVGFFDAMEAGVRACHALGYVHLDLHNARNVMVAPGFRPVLLDWQSALPVRFMPRPIRRFLEKVDLGGVAKFRMKFHPETASEADLRRARRWSFLRRHVWFPRIRIRTKRKGAGA